MYSTLGLHTTCARIQVGLCDTPESSVSLNQAPWLARFVYLIFAPPGVDGEGGGKAPRSSVPVLGHVKQNISPKLLQKGMHYLCC